MCWCVQNPRFSLDLIVVLQVLANFGVLLTLLCGHIVQRIFFGSLRPNEVEVSIRLQSMFLLIFRHLAFVRSTVVFHH